ncbi:MAG TPA: molybdopterin cofactor-binding domain-containing protein [Gammaproteobacteria bacterium]
MSRDERFAPDPYLPEFLQKMHFAAAAAATRRLSRRNFMKLTGVAGGGLVIAFAVGPGARKALAQARAHDVFIANPYVQVKSDGTIVLFAKNPEVGQGVKTALPMIVAEELDANWDDVQVQQAEINVALYGAQFAGGSTSVALNWDALRRAGAVARAMLVAAAAREWGVPESELVTEASTVMHKASGRSATYGELAEAAAELPMPDPASVPLKERSQYRLLGKRITGVDNRKIVTGQPLFGIDQVVPGMLYATFTKAPAIGAKAVSANLDHVKSLRGVKDAFILEQQGDPIAFKPDAAALSSGVAILADSTWNAFQAKRALQVTWDESEASKDSWTAAVAEAQALAAKGEAALLGETGDMDAALRGAAHTVEALYTYQYVSHADLEPQNCTAWFKGDSVEVWAPTQTPQAAVDGVAALTGLPKEKITLHQLRGGGGFGRRLANDSVCEAVAISRRAGGVPVKVQWMREDDMAFDYYRPGGFHSFKAAVDRAGKLVGWEDHFITFSHDGQTPVTAGNLSPQEFPANVVPNSRIRQSLIASRIPTGPWRAPGSNAIAFAVQCFLHECAVAAGRDHVEFLLDVMGEPRLVVPDNPRVLHTGRAANVIRLAAEKAGWGRTLPEGRGLGLAFHFSHLGHFAEVAEVSVDASKRVTLHKVWVVGDIGPIVNLSGAENQAQGSVIDGFSTAMGLEITFENGRAQQTNFDKYPILRIDKAPEVEVHFVQSDYPPTGVGEPALPPAAPAIANAIYAATGHRIRTMPFKKEGFGV